MLCQYDRNMILYWLTCYGGKKIEPMITDAFWEKASQYELREVYFAIRKASDEEEFTIERITYLIGKITKEGNMIVYKTGVKRNVPEDQM